MARLPWQITREMFLSVDEVDRLLAHVRAESDSLSARTDRVIVETLLFTGLRNSEFCNLKLRDVKLGKSESVIKVGGRGDEQKHVFIPSQLDQLLQDYIKNVRPHSAAVGMRDTSGPLIFNEHKRQFERSTLYRRVVRILTEAGLGNRASVQLLRHTYGYLAYQRTGGNLLFVQQQLGHAHPMITSVYAKFVTFSNTQLADSIVGKPKSESRKRQPLVQTSR